MIDRNTTETQLDLFEQRRVDMMHKTCEKCADGYYSEQSMFDDLHGTLTCTNCIHKVKRYRVL